MLIMRTMLRYNGDREARISGRSGVSGRSGARPALLLVATLLLVALAAGCSNDSAQRSEQAQPETGRASSEETGSPETIQGTTSQESSGEAESTVGTVPSETADTGDQGAGAQSGADQAAGASPEETGEISTPTQSEEPLPQEESGEKLKAGANPGGFVAAPEGSGGSGYGTDGILGVRFGDHGGYERVVVDLGSGGKPAAGVPDWTLSSPTGDGRLKLSFPSVRNTAVSDGSLEDAGAELLDSFYVVRGPDGGMFVDFFAERAFYYRVIELPNPSRVAVDFKPSGSDLALPLPVREGNTVLTEPRRDEAITSPVTVSGYSRNPEASNTIMLQGPGGQTLARETALSNDWTSTWGYFETSLDFQPFTGEALLRVGAPSARDGSFEGVELPVEPAR